MSASPRSDHPWPVAALRLLMLTGAACVFPEDLTTDRLYTFWVGVREQAGLPGLRIHDARHTYASQGLMNGAGLATVGKLLGHRRRETIAIYAHLDDAALRDDAAQAAAVIARAMGYRAEPPALPDETDGAGIGPGEPAQPTPLDCLDGEPGASGSVENI